MKNNTVQAPQKAISKQSTPQVTEPKYSLELTGWRNGKPEVVAGFDISAADLGKLLVNADKLNKSGLKELLKIGVEAMLNAIPSTTERENAMRQSNALAMMLYELIEHGEESSFVGGGQDNGRLLAGLQDLVWSTQERLAKAI